MKALENKEKHRYPASEWNTYARLFTAVTTSMQLDVYREACLHLQGDVVDCGCGSAKIAPFLADMKSVSSYTGIDYAVEMITAAHWVLSTLDQPNFSLQHCKIEEAQGSFDSAVSIQSYYTWPDPLQVLSHIAKLLKTGGSFVLVTPNQQLDLHKLIKDARKELLAHPDFEDYKEYNLKLANNPDANFVEMDSLIEQAKQVGFSVSECHQRHFKGGLNFLVLHKKG